MSGFATAGLEDGSAICGARYEFFWVFDANWRG